ncbi:MAG: hypothetical protein ACYDA6_03670 [Solirubrobacteraceae bacterium]
MRANRAYRLIVKRGGWLPAAFADPGRVDHVEVVDLPSSEVLLFWDLPPRRAARLVRALRADLARLEPEAFRSRWVSEDGTEHDAPQPETDAWV